MAHYHHPHRLALVLTITAVALGATLLVLQWACGARMVNRGAPGEPTGASVCVSNLQWWHGLFLGAALVALVSVLTKRYVVALLGGTALLLGGALFVRTWGLFVVLAGSFLIAAGLLARNLDSLGIHHGQGIRQSLYWSSTSFMLWFAVVAATSVGLFLAPLVLVMMAIGLVPRRGGAFAAGAGGVFAGLLAVARLQSADVDAAAPWYVALAVLGVGALVGALRFPRNESYAILPVAAAGFLAVWIWAPFTRIDRLMVAVPAILLVAGVARCFLVRPLPRPWSRTRSRSYTAR